MGTKGSEVPALAAELSSGEAAAGQELWAGRLGGGAWGDEWERPAKLRR